MTRYTDDLNYYTDPRVACRDGLPVLYFVDDDGYDAERELPTKWEVCDVCQGRGVHVNPSIDCNGLTADDFADDPDLAEDYLRGVYDVPCNQCHGRTTVLAVDWDRLSDDERDAYQKQLDAEAADRRYAAMERALGA